MKGKLIFMVGLIILLALLIRFSKPSKSSDAHSKIMDWFCEFQDKYDDVVDSGDWQLFDEIMSDGG